MGLAQLAIPLPCMRPCANMKPVLYQGIQPGGQLTITTEVENYPGYPNGIQGPEMMVDFEKQAARMGTDIRFGIATKVDFSKQPYKIWIDEQKLIEADAVIIATGASAKWLGLPSEQRLNGFGVSACAVCDGFFFRGKEVAIVGAGDTAAEEALYLSKLCTTVHMLVRRDQMRASKVMQERVLKTPNIKMYWNSEADEVLGENKVEALRIKIIKPEKKQISLSVVFLSPSVTNRIQIFLSHGSTWTKQDISRLFRALPKPMWKAFLLQGMCRIKFTARR